MQKWCKKGVVKGLRERERLKIRGSRNTLAKVYHLKEGDTLTLVHDVRLHMDTVTEGKDEEWFYFFTGEEESRLKQCGNVIMSLPLYEMMKIAYKSDKVQGLVINPFGKYVRLTKELLGFILKEFTENWQED